MTQYRMALRGEISNEMIEAARHEGMTPEELCLAIAEGAVVVPHNRSRKFSARAIGRGCTIKVNANIGTSGLSDDAEGELKKLAVAVDAGADAVMDLSTGANLSSVRKRMLASCPVMLGTVPLYAVMACMAEKRIPFRTMDGRFVVEEIRKQAEEGVDFMTIHAGLTRRSLSFLDRDARVAGIVSRGGSFLARWIRSTGKENPFFEEFDEILGICREHDVTISLGDGLRPGAGSDSGDAAQIAEVLELGLLVRRCRDAGVQVMVEGPGHVPLDQIEAQVALTKRLCHGAPLYVLGPLPTDIGAGRDHVTAAIGGALAGWKGADFLCYVTPAEHLCLPDGEDVREGILASRLAAHVADIARGRTRSAERDRSLSACRKRLAWAEQFELCLDPELARSRRASSVGEGEEPDSCTMCGALCSMKDEQ